MTTFVFPGQGSQTIGMGEALFPQFPDYVQKANSILGYDIVELCLQDPRSLLGKTNYTQPALYIVNALTWLEKSAQEKPNYLAGHSLGEYNALFAAGVFDFETGLKLVQKRGELMSQAMGGGMAAVLGLSSDDIEKVLQDSALTAISIANYNSFNQTVITGSQQAITDAQPVFENAGATMYIPLNVSGAFHSPFMKPAAESFRTFLQSFTYNPPTIPVIANIDAKPYQSMQIADSLTKQITHSVLWRQTVEYLLSQGETVFEELGPGRVLSGLIKRIQQGK